MCVINSRLHIFVLGCHLGFDNRQVQKSDWINLDRQCVWDKLGSTWVDSDCLGSWKKNIKLNEVETFTHLKVKILVKSGPNVVKPSFFILSASSSPTCLVFQVDPS